jgi:hypothetical protein
MDHIDIMDLTDSMDIMDIMDLIESMDIIDIMDINGITIIPYTYIWEATGILHGYQQHRVTFADIQSLPSLYSRHAALFPTARSFFRFQKFTCILNMLHCFPQHRLPSQFPRGNCAFIWTSYTFPTAQSCLTVEQCQ